MQAWFYVTWAVFVAGAAGWRASLLFALCSALLWHFFLRSWRSDPGVIRASTRDKFRVSAAPPPPPPPTPRPAPPLTLPLPADHHRAVGEQRRRRRLRPGALLLGVPGAAAAALQALLRVQPLRGALRPPLPLGRQLHR